MIWKKKKSKGDQRGYTILRFTGKEIAYDVDECVSKIVKHLQGEAAL